MKHIIIGDLRLPALGQGVGGNENYDDSRWIDILRQGIDLGMTLIDTAEIYRDGRSEEIVGKAIEGRRENVLVFTKVSPQHCHYDDVLKSLENSLRRLKTDYVDCYQIHWPNPSIPLEETIRAMLDLKSAGKVRHLGVSNFTLTDFRRVRQISEGKMVSNQIEYNLVDRGIESNLLPYAIEQECLLIAYNPLLFSKSKLSVLQAIARRHGKSVCQVVLRWLIEHKNVIAIPKTLNPAHLQENATSADYDLDPPAYEEIEKAFAYRVIDVPVKRIRVPPSSSEVVYTSLEEALANKAEARPSPQEIAEDIRACGVLKPFRLVPTADKSGPYLYDLAQGKMRYWGWVIVHGGESSIPAYVME